MKERDPRPGESDVDRDDAQALSRASGGVPDDEQADQHSTTGTTPSGEFVGRASGDDPGYEERTGAEARAEADRPE